MGSVMFCDLHVSLNNPSSGDISTNLSCSLCIGQVYKERAQRVNDFISL